VADLEARLTGLVNESVVPVFKSRGYRKSRLTWVREAPAAVHEITLQRSHGNDAEHLRFYVEVAAYVPEFARALGHSVPDSLSSGTPQYRRRFEEIVGWPQQWIDLESWRDEELRPRFRDAVDALADHLDRIVTAEELIAALKENSPGLDLDLFAWWCATDNVVERDAQYALAHERFGQEPRWPRLVAQFERVAALYERSVPAANGAP